MLKVTNMNVYYGNIYAIKDVNFEVKEGEIVTLIGANGAGKSTILKTISGLLRSKTGSIAFKNEVINTAPSHAIVKRGLAHVPEGRRIFANLSVRDNLEMGAFSRKDRSALNADYEMVYGIFPRLKERLRQIAGTLSGGEQQMLAIGRALMAKPRLLLLDEPSMGLAPILVDEIFEVIKSINQAGTTIFLVEQNAYKALALADRGYILETGQVVKSGPASELMKDSAVKAAYLGG